MHKPFRSSSTANVNNAINLLKINKSRLVGVQHEPASIGADGVLADGRLRVFKLLLHIFNDRLAVEAEEGTAHQLWVNGVGTYHLPADTQQCADTGRR